jgi:ATP-binding cassette subfamily C (CFTR/MRP) protein 4
VFLTIALYNPVRVMMTFYWPWGIQQLSEARVSTQRIQELLLMEETEESEPKDDDHPHPTNCRLTAARISGTWDAVRYEQQHQKHL